MGPAARLTHFHFNLFYFVFRQSVILCCCFPCAVSQQYKEVLLGEIQPEPADQQEGYDYENYNL